jgi:formylmethanofuran dehydrogenase subunit E
MWETRDDEPITERDPLLCEACGERIKEDSPVIEDDRVFCKRCAWGPIRGALAC